MIDGCDLVAPTAADLLHDQLTSTVLHERAERPYGRAGVLDGIAVAVVLSVAAEAGVAHVMMMMVVRLMQMLQMVMVMVVVYRDWDSDWYLYRHRDGLLHRDVLLNRDGVWAIDRNLHWDRDGLLDRVRNVLLNVVRLRDGHLDRVRDGLLHRHGVGTIDRDLHLIRDWLLDGVRHGFLHLNGVGSWHMDRIGTVDRDLHRVRDLLLDGVRHWDGHFHLHWHWHVLGNFVGLRDWHLDWVRDVLGHFVGLGHEHLDGVGTIDRNMDRVGHLLLNRVGLRHMDGHLNVFLDVDWDVFDYFVGLRYRDLHWIGDMLLHGVRDVLLNRVRYRDTLHQRYRLGHIRVATEIHTMPVVMVMCLMVRTAKMATTDVAYVQPVNAVAITEAQQAPFVQLLLERDGGLTIGCGLLLL
uniref:Uncharacterized protein n=1 Tax=Anopheles coluzzii TaxID=1518534 RepID=A0A8W7P7K5_ANOCL